MCSGKFHLLGKCICAYARDPSPPTICEIRRSLVGRLAAGGGRVAVAAAASLFVHERAITSSSEAQTEYVIIV